MADQGRIKENMVKLTYARLLFADFILDEGDEKEIIDKIKEVGFRDLDNGKSLSFEIGTTRTSGDFIEQLQSRCKSDPATLKYINNIIVRIYKDSTLPRSVITIEAILDVDGLQKLKKQDLEAETWALSLLLGKCFYEPTTPDANSSNGLRILKFSSKAISNSLLINSVADFVFKAEHEFFDDFSQKLDSLGISTNETVLMQGSGAVRKEVITLEPISFLDGGFSYDQSIVRGYGDRVFIIGKIVQGSMADSVPMYLATIISATYDNISPYLASRPGLVFHGGFPFLDFSFGPGQILALQLLNSWNRYEEELLLKGLAAKQTPVSINVKTEIAGDIEELRNLISYRGINQKISVNLEGELLVLTDPSGKTFLYELLMPLEAGSISGNPERYGWEKPGPLVSKLATLVLNGLKLNNKHLSDLISFKRSRINILKFEEDRKNSRTMKQLTAVVAIATIVNVFLFIIIHF